MTRVKASAIINIKTIEGSTYMNKKEEYQEMTETQNFYTKEDYEKAIEGEIRGSGSYNENIYDIWNRHIGI